MRIYNYQPAIVDGKPCQLPAGLHAHAHRRALWAKWVRLGLPLPDAQTGLLGLKGLRPIADRHPLAQPPRIDAKRLKMLQTVAHAPQPAQHAKNPNLGMGTRSGRHSAHKEAA